MITMPILRISAAVAMLAAPATAQNNSLFILQDNSTGGMSNTISVDQSAASRSRVGSAETPAEQIGGGNVADVSIVGEGSRVDLSQRSVTSRVDGNDVSIDLSGTTLLGTVSQAGSGNRGAVSVSGARARGSLVQDGNFNAGTVSVSGSDASGALRQIGDGNATDLEVSGAGTSVTYDVIGNGLTAVVPPTVRSNGATVTITQTGPGAPK